MLPHSDLNALLSEIRNCRLCSGRFEHEPRPVVQVGVSSKILIVGQAPGRKVHESGIPWDDKSGEKLREWMGITRDTFYNPDLISILPMGFCFPGKGKSGDLPPSEICAPTWHEKILRHLPEIKLILLVGNYAQDYYLKDKSNLTGRVKKYKEYLPFIPLPHPSPRNFMWFRGNPEFEKEVLPFLEEQVKEVFRI